MQLNISQIAKKEVSVFFASPSAFLFLGTYLAVTLFIFFWVETFFARNIADIRPLFEWMPILLAFLSAALTMKLWSEERRMGTLEFLLTKPVGVFQLVVGKFLACLTLTGIALALTIFIPITVSMFGNVDWGPIFGAYIATFCLAAAYIAIGLTISSNSDNQIVSLIVSTIACLALYALGSDTITAFFSSKISELLKLLGSGARFSAISRGVLDLRDIYYYLSIVGIFLSLNIYFLEKTRWSQHEGNTTKNWWRTVTLLLVLNLIASNLWLQHVRFARLDLTQGHIYSISPATKQYISQLEEPLLIRGYFSSKLHPFLAPLAPQLQDLLEEYEVAAKGKIQVEFIDPLQSPALELEANEKYGLKPVPFQVADKYQAALVNAYFNVVVQYGDQFEVLGFRDLIEVKASQETDIDVTLRNPEYEITRSIKKVTKTYQGGGDVFSSITTPVKFTLYTSNEAKLPEPILKLKQEIDAYLVDQNNAANGKLLLASFEPELNSGEVAQEIAAKYGFQPMRVGLLDPKTFYFYMTMEQDGQIVQIPIPEDLSFTEFKRYFETGIKRFSPGFMKTLAFYNDETVPDDYHGLKMYSGRNFNTIKQKLGQSYIIKDTDLKSGVIPRDADVLLVAKPNKLDKKQLFAIDQFLMKGGSVILATSPFAINVTAQGFSASKHESGLGDWLKHNGLEIADAMVLDPQNSRIAIPVERKIAGLTIQDYYMAEYPYFVDIRQSGFSKDNMITSTLPQLTLSWASPIKVVATENAATRKVVPLLQSSNKAWASDSLDIVPDFDQHGNLGVKPSGDNQVQQLGVMLEGKFTSYFAEQDSPLLALADPDAKADKAAETDEAATAGLQYQTPITKSPESARIILYASNEFLNDDVIRLVSVVNNDLYLNSTQLIENSIDWSLEDRELLSIRSRGHFMRTLMPMSTEVRMFWEYGNYLLGIAGLVVVYFVRCYYTSKNHKRQQMLLGS